jgi:hypothetical protein
VFRPQGFCPPWAGSAWLTLPTLGPICQYPAPEDSLSSAASSACSSSLWPGSLVRAVTEMVPTFGPFPMFQESPPPGGWPESVFPGPPGSWWSLQMVQRWYRSPLPSGGAQRRRAVQRLKGVQRCRPILVSSRLTLDECPTLSLQHHPQSFGEESNVGPPCNGRPGPPGASASVSQVLSVA